jgi:hypothetical protein
MPACERVMMANIFPLMEGAAFDALVADIVMYEGLLFDGRNRWRAAEAAGITITDKDIKQFDPKKDSDPLAWIISKNLQRRMLDESQRAMVAAKLATLKQGARTDLAPIGAMSEADAAAMLNVGERSVERANPIICSRDRSRVWSGQRRGR